MARFKIKDTQSRGRALKAVSGAPDKMVVTISLTLHLVSPMVRQRAESIVAKLSPNWIVRVARRKRSDEQNALMWVLLTQISEANPHGVRKTPEQWKFLYMHGLKHACQFELDLEGKPFAVGFSTSKFNTKQMSDMIEYIYSDPFELGVKFTVNPNEKMLIDNAR